MQSCATKLRIVQVEALLSGEADANDTYLEVHAGAGGTESQDWAEMLLRMYTRWAQSHGFKIAIVDEAAGEGAGIKSATIEVKGKNAYGWLKTEAGVHRLVRISPYDSNARRHTSFSSITVYPAIDDDIKIDIAESDVRVDTMRSGGAGGQHVNKTESAVRLTHMPTGIAVVSQGDRSQHKNRAEAWRMLRAKLYEAELKRREEKAAADQAAKSDIGWGHQIRSLRAAALSAGEGPAHRRHQYQPRAKCSTANSTNSWKPNSRAAFSAADRRMWKMWNKRLGALVAASFSAVTSAYAADPTGMWSSRDNEARVQIFNCGQAICGKIAALTEPNDPQNGKPKLDKFNKDESKRERPRRRAANYFRPKAKRDPQSVAGQPLQSGRRKYVSGTNHAPGCAVVAAKRLRA